MAMNIVKRPRLEPGAVPVNFSHTLALKVGAEVRMELYGGSTFQVASNRARFSQPLYFGGPSIDCSASFIPNILFKQHYYATMRHNQQCDFEFTINWSKEAKLKCLAEVYLSKGNRRWERDRFECVSGSLTKVPFSMDSIKNSFVDDDKTFTIFLAVSATGSVATPSHALEKTDPVSHQIGLSVDCEKMFLSDLFSDVEVKCEGRTFKCHKTMLAARSEVFAAMLTGNFKEGKDNAVVVKEMDPAVLHNMLRYIYSGKIEKTNVSVALFRASHFYNIKGLAKECCSALAKDLSLDNCCEVLEMAHLYDDKNLFGQAIGFFKEHKNTLMSSPKWKQIEENRGLMNAIMLQM